MITKFKIYEGRGIYPREGNYVITTTIVGMTWNGVKTTEQHRNYLNTHVGRIINSFTTNIEYDSPYNVEYENPPEFMKDVIQDNDLWFSRDDILHFSNDKEKLLKIADDIKLEKEAEKFNL